MKNTLRFVSFILLPLISVIIGMVKYLYATETDKIQASFVLFTLATVVVIPLFAVFVGLSLLRYNLDGTNDSLKKLNEDIASKNIDFLRETKIIISDTITRGSNYYNIHLSEHKETLSDFIKPIINEFNKKIKALSEGHLYENDPSKYQEFCSSIFNLVRQGGSIKATSIVNPDVFWEDENTINYLRNNKKLIEGRNVTIERYFFINEENKNSSLKAIANNLSVNVIVSIIKEDEIKKKEYIKDCGLVDKSIAIESKVDSSRNIFKVDVFIGDKQRYSEISTLFDLLNSKKIRVEDFYSKSKEDIINEYAEISFE